MKSLILRFVLLTSIFGNSTLVLSQMINADSIRNLITRDISVNTQTIERLQSLSSYYYRINPDSSLYFAKTSGEMAQKISNSRLLGISKFLEANIFMDKIEGDHARTLFSEAINLLESSGEREKILEATVNYGVTYISENNYSEAKIWIEKAQKLAQKQKNLKIQASATGNLGLIADMEGDKQTAIDLYTQAARYYEQVGDKGRTSILKHNIGALYSNMEDQQQAIKYTLEACSGYLEVKNFKSLNNAWLNLVYYYKEIDNLTEAELFLEKVRNTSLPLSPSQQALYYLLNGQLEEKRQNFKQALLFIDSCISKAISANSPINLHNGYATKARINLQQKNYDTAFKAATAALDIADQMNDAVSINLDQKMAAQSSQGLGYLNQSLEYWNAYETGRDTLYTQEKFQAIENIQKKYETEKKELLIKQQEISLKQQQTVLIAIGVGLILAVMTVILLFKNNIEKSRANQLLSEQNEQLMLANDQFIQDLEKTKRENTPIDELKNLKVRLSQRSGREIALGDIIYIEGNGNFVTIHTTSGIFHDWQYVSHYESMLADSTLFCRTHRSFLVNRLHVVNRKSQELIMSNGQAVAIATTTATKSVVHSWFDQWEAS